MRNSFRAYSAEDKEYAKFMLSEEILTQQGTGINDKNGNEIFEGDYIYLENFEVGFDDSLDDFIDLDEVREVMFKDGCFIVGSLWDSNVYCNIDMINPKLSRIVGNIYKTPLTSDRLSEI